MASKPATKFVVHAAAHADGYTAMFAVPGLVPDYVREDGGAGKPRVYPSRNAAMNGAREALLWVLSAQMLDTTKAGGYLRMSGADLAVALTEANLTPTLFAELYGVPQARVMKWLMGEQDIPHSAHLLVRLLATEDNLNRAVAMTTHAREKGSDDGRESQD